MAIDVVFAGLMLICLEGQSDCSGRYEKNTAWVVKADGLSKPCDRESKEITKLKLRFPINVDVKDPKEYCKKDQASWLCTLPEGDICISPSNGAADQLLDHNLDLLPRINEVDNRFERVKNLDNPAYIPTRIHFAGGKISSGPKWHEDEAIKWYRSNMKGGGFPRELADRLKVTYQTARGLNLIDCMSRDAILTLPQQTANVEVVFQNFAETPLVPDYTDDRYDDLAYLLWYYRLGSWNDTGGRCPTYTEKRKEAVLLRCAPKNCSFFSRGNTKYWPVMLGPDKGTAASRGTR